MNTRFHVRRKVLDGLSPVRLAAKNGQAVAPQRTTEISPPNTIEPIAIDTGMFGEAEVMAAHLLPGERPALIDAGPANTTDTVIQALAELGIRRLDSIILTHIHFENAGGAAKLAKHFPEATVYIHRGVTDDLAEPSRLVESLRPIWGDDLEGLFGLPEPIAADRIRPLDDGDSIDLGGRMLEAIETPGHTESHMAFIDRGTGAMICGDALGIKLPGSKVIRPSTPPSDFSREDAINSIAKLRCFDPATVHLAHYGESAQGPGETFDRATLAINEWHASFLKKSEMAENEEELLRSVNACVEATLEPVPPSVRRGFETINPTWLNIAGMSDERNRQHDDLADAV